MIVKTSKIIISKIYNLNSINNLIDLYLDQNLLLIISKDLIILIINKTNSQVYSFKVIIFENEEDIFFEFVKIINFKRITENLFEANLLIKNLVKGIYLLNISLKLIDNQIEIFLNNYDYLDFKFVYFINNDLLNLDYNINNSIILVDKGIYDINIKNFVYKEEDILKSSYLELRDIVFSFLIDQKIFFITKKGLLFIFEINHNKELKFVNSLVLDNFYHKNLMNIKYFFVKNKVFIFLDGAVYFISDLDNLNQSLIKKNFLFELFKDFYSLNNNSFEKLNGIISYKDDYFLIFDDYLVLFDVDNLKFNKIKDFEWKDNLVKLKFINNSEYNKYAALAIFEQKIIYFKNIFENTLFNEINLNFNQRLLLNIKDNEQDKIKDNLIFDEIDRILTKNNVNNYISFLNLLSINKYNDFYFVFFDIPIFAILDNKNFYFYPILFDNYNFDYKKTILISSIGNLIFFKSEDSYYCAEFEIILEDYPKCFIKNIKSIYIHQENILKKPIAFADNKVFFLYQNKIYFLNLNENNFENEDNLILINLKGSNDYNILDVNYFDNNFIYFLYINNDDIILKHFEIDFNLSINLVNEVIFKNVSDYYKKLLSNSTILDLKLFDNSKFYIKILKGNIIYNLEVVFDNLETKIKLVNNFNLNIDNILKVFKVNNLVFLYSNNKLYYINLETNYLDFVSLFKVNKKVEYTLDILEALDLFLVNNLVVVGKIEDFTQWKKIIFLGQNILDILFYEDKLILFLEIFIVLDVPNRILNLEKTNFIEFVYLLYNIIYFKKHFNNKFLKGDKLFLLDDIGNFWIFNIKTNDFFKTYLGYLNEGKIISINNNIYIVNKEDIAIFIE